MNPKGVATDTYDGEKGLELIPLEKVEVILRVRRFRRPRQVRSRSSCRPYFHPPLHRGLRVELHAYHGRLLSPPAKRTSHVLSRPDISSATDNFLVFPVARL